MIAQRLLDELQQLNQDEKLEVVRFLNEELSDDVEKIPKGARLFKTWPTIISSEEAISTLLQLEDESKDND
ncbi:MAG: hypothetical protein OXG23_10665 [Chloroflexi bacterium]|nr:hypothetical protein [Chloroflexota bacterium]MCY3978550.1 hypothetical protein [Chloroflexota bacterium]